MLYIVKTNDKRHYHLYEFLKNKINTIYSNKVIPGVKKLVLPMNGIDQDGYIYGTFLKLEDFYNFDVVEEIYTGYKNKYLEHLCKIHNTKLVYFYSDINFVRKEFDIEEAIIKSFLEEKLSTTFKELNVVVIGSSYTAYLMSLKLKCDLIKSKVITTEELSKYDAIIHFDSVGLSNDYKKIMIDMNDGECLDFYFLYNVKELYFMKQLLTQYMTKSSAKIMYDCMCLNDSI